MTGRGVTPCYLLLLLLLLVQILEGKVEVKQPPVASTPVVRVVASRGEEVQISCPVDGNPPPIIEWSKVGLMICREWNGAFPDWGRLAKDSATKLKRCQLNVCTVYGVLFPPPPLLWLKFVPGWPAIFVSS
jgi:hypothetical protein